MPQSHRSWVLWLTIAVVALGVPLQSQATPGPATGTPGPTRLAAGLELSYLSAAATDRTVLLGEVRNTGGSPRPSPYLRLALLDADGNIVGTVDGEPAWPWLPPHDAVPVEAQVAPGTPNTWRTFQVTACTDVRPDGPADPTAGLTVGEVRVVRQDNGVVELTGQVSNHRATAAGRTTVVVALYGRDGRFVGSEPDLDLQNVAIPAGKFARFDVIVTPYVTAFTGLTWRVWAGTWDGGAGYNCPTP